MQNHCITKECLLYNVVLAHKGLRPSSRQKMLLCHAAKTAYFRAGVPRLEKAALLASAVRFTGTLVFPILLNQHAAAQASLPNLVQVL